MLTIFRPSQGRIVAGVARAMAERYRVSVTIVRIVFIGAILSAPISILIYLLLAISAPAEESVVSELRLMEDDALPSPRARFDRLTSLLLRRVARREERSAKWLIASLLALCGIAMELNNAHPFMSGIAL